MEARAGAGQSKIDIKVPSNSSGLLKATFDLLGSLFNQRLGRNEFADRPILRREARFLKTVAQVLNEH